MGDTDDGDHEDGSSSLSEVEERTGMDAAAGRSSPLSNNDTEAETERLEQTPHNTRTHRQVTLRASGDATDALSTLEDAAELQLSAMTSPAKTDADEAGGEREATSEMSSLANSSDEEAMKSPSSTISRKRKREESTTTRSLKRAAIQLANEVAERETRARSSSRSPQVHITTERGEAAAERESIDGDASGVEDGDKDDGEVDPLSRAETPESGDDAEEDAAEPDVAPSARSEEDMLKKKSAMGSLTGIEQQFAALRDCLFSERTRQLQDELAMLDGPEITHPDYRMIVDAIAQQRRSRVALAQTTLSYKLQDLRSRCIAERAIQHSQYMQRVRQIREQVIETANRDWFQIQRERRKMDDESSNTLPLLSSDRQDLIAGQIAYNMEVSILSGFAKHVGFPAAPDLNGATAIERDEDLRRMGISSSQSAVAGANVPHARSAAEQFLEKTPWANPLHPAHTQLSDLGTLPPQAGQQGVVPHTQEAVNGATGELGAIDGSATNPQNVQSLDAATSWPMTSNATNKTNVPLSAVKSSSQVPQATNAFAENGSTDSLSKREPTGLSQDVSGSSSRLLGAPVLDGLLAKSTDRLTSPFTQNKGPAEVKVGNA